MRSLIAILSCFEVLHFHPKPVCCPDLPPINESFFLVIRRVAQFWWDVEWNFHCLTHESNQEGNFRRVKY